MKKLYISYIILSAMTLAYTSAAASSSTPDEEAIADSVAEAQLKMLDDVVVTAAPKLVVSDGAKLTYNVSEDAEAKSSNILEILKKVPGVTVDAEDNVRVKGQQSFKILINNREDPMLKGDIKTALKSIPAASILKIEVISEPGAKYESEGIAGVLNIVTDRKSTLDGILTQLGAWINAYHAGGNANVRTKIGNVTASANVSYNNGRIWKRYSENETDIFYLDNDTDSPESNALQHTDRRQRNNAWDYVGANLNMSWEPDTLNLFTLGLNIGNNTWGSPYTETRTMYDQRMNQLWSLTRNVDNDGRYLGTGGQASYQHTFGKEGHNIVASYAFNWNRQKADMTFATEGSEGAINEAPWQSNINHNYDITHIVQIDYANPINSKHTLEAGAKVDINHARNRQTPWSGNDEASAVPDESRALSLLNFRDKYAAYISWSGSFGKFRAKAGVRYEHVDLGIKYYNGDHEDFTRRLNDIVPNAALSMSFTDASSLRLAYQMRTSRPNVWSLNPYVSTQTPGVISYGNPNLKTATSHSISLGYSNYDHPLSGEVKVSYDHSKNQVTDIIFMKDGLMNMTYDNVGQYHSAFLELSINYSINSIFSLSAYGSTSYSYRKADSELLKAKKCGWNGGGSAYVNYTLPCKLRLSAGGGYYSPWQDLQTRGTDFYYYNIGASRSFLADDALTITASVTNLFPTHLTNSYSQTDPSVRFESSSRYPQWNCGINISYRFGKLKADVKRTNAIIDLDNATPQKQGK